MLQEFNFDGDFQSLYAAEKWLADHGYSVASGCAQSGGKHGILKGDWVIAKWRNLTKPERAALDGVLIAHRTGVARIQIYEPGESKILN